MVKGRQFVKKVIRKCFICKRLEGKPYSFPKTAPLPDFRVNEAPPFSRVGVDFARPLYCKGTRGNPIKVNILLFSCCVTRAIHLELTYDLSASSFLNALKRFASRRGTISLIISENAKTFKATAKPLKKFSRNLDVRLPNFSFLFYSLLPLILLILRINFRLFRKLRPLKLLQIVSWQALMLAVFLLIFLFLNV